MKAPLVFVGYAIERGKDGYRGFDEGLDLTGKIAVALRFEPMNENGKSLWSKRRWSGRNSLLSKVKAVADRNAAGMIIINTRIDLYAAIQTLFMASC